MTPAETLAKAKQLDRFLSKAITETKASDRAAMNKFAELAMRSAELHKAAEARADRMADRLAAIPDLLERAFVPHETKLDELEHGVDVLEKSLHSMIGHNGGPLPDSPRVSPPSSPVIDPPVAVDPPAIEPPVAPPPPVVPEPVAESISPPPVPVLDPTANGNAPA